MAITTFKNHIGKEDVRNYDGVNRTFTRPTSTGGNLSLHAIGDMVDVAAVFGNGTTMTNASIAAAVQFIGSRDATLLLAPGAWTISASVTIPVNIGLNIAHGALVTIAADQTFTINGPFAAGLYQVFSGEGGVAFGGGSVDGVTPIWFGADPTGVADSSTAFSSAAQAAPAGCPQEIYLATLPFPDWSYLYLPPGTYLLSSVVDTGNKEIVYFTAPGVEFSGTSREKLNGKVFRPGSKCVDFHHGHWDNATTFSISANHKVGSVVGGNQDYDEMARISGYSSPAKIGAGNGRDSVALYAGNMLPPPLFTASGTITYSETGATFSVPISADVLKQLRKGMSVVTAHATPWGGILDSWTSTSITVSIGWYAIDGSDSNPPSTPTPDNTAFYLNHFRKAWAIDAVAFIDSLSSGDDLTICELGVRNQKADSTLETGGTTEVNGIQIGNINNATDGVDFYNNRGIFITGRWVRGFQTGGETKYAFYHDGTSGHDASDPTDLLALLYAKNHDNQNFFIINGTGCVDAGTRGVADDVTYEFHTGATETTYDSRIKASGGTGADGGGNLQVDAAIFYVSAPIFPFADDAYHLGKNSITDPLAWKGLCVKDTTNGNYYRIEVTNGSIVATQIT